MYLPTANELKVLQVRNHREKEWRRLMAQHEKPKHDDFVRKLKTARVYITCTIKDTIIHTPDTHHVYFFYRNNEYTQRLFQALTKIFTNKGYTVEEFPTKLKISWN